ncbi:radical SAM protein [Pseudomonas sp. BN411]|uniref:radical SAM protein n=1 Tax=Pseudomonas sp. BN411 TaxID=2567887 RepID=UPI002458C3D2|nr:radical SAM protein [Pseudomonas sp. BN411]MDH4562426.1 radical SAM protein [Pseudomonas sp. BN411]
MSEREGPNKRFEDVRQEVKSMRSSLYHLTNKCNSRCKGCWFFEFEFDTRVHELDDIEVWQERGRQEAERGINAPLLISGEPSIFLDWVKFFMEYMPMVTVSTNGLKKIPGPISVSLYGHDIIREIEATSLSRR